MFKARKVVQEIVNKGGRQKEIPVFDEVPEDHVLLGFSLLHNEKQVAFIPHTDIKWNDDMIAHGLNNIARYLNNMENATMSTRKKGIMDIIRDYEKDTDYPCHDRLGNLVMVFSYNLQQEIANAGFQPVETKDYLGYEVAVYVV